MAQSNDRASRSLAKWLGDLLEPGERPVVDVHLDAGYGRATVDIPDKGVTAVLTDRRILLVEGVRKPSTWWWFPLDVLSRIDVETIKPGFNKGWEFAVTFTMNDGATKTGVVMAAGRGKKGLRRFTEAVERLRPSTVRWG